jgi:hypothetical protein
MEGLLPPPVGTSDWARFSRTSYCVDKTLILKDLIDSESTVVLFTRPRRFGKTTVMEMIRPPKGFTLGNSTCRMWEASDLLRGVNFFYTCIFSR